MDRKIYGKRLRSAIYSHGVASERSSAHRADRIAHIGKVLALKYFGGTLAWYCRVLLLSGISSPPEVETDALMTPRKGREHAVTAWLYYLQCDVPLL
jgi:hypothetical protein